MKKYLAVLRRPLFLILLNFFFVNTLFSLLPVSTGNLAYNLGRISIIFYGGWLVRSKKIGGIWQAAIAGVALYFADHVIIKGGLFLLNYLFKPEGMGLSAFGGVVVSFIFFIPLAMLFGMLGAIAAQRRKTADPE